jgi:hypothetical protein
MQIDEHEMPGWHAWRARMLQIQASGVRCRLCRFIARKKRGLAFTESSEEMLTPEGARFQREAEARYLTGTKVLALLVHKYKY